MSKEEYIAQGVSFCLLPSGFYASCLSLMALSCVLTILQHVALWGYCRYIMNIKSFVSCINFHVRHTGFKHRIDVTLGLYIDIFPSFLIVMIQNK